MVSGSWCSGMGVGGWLVMILFWGAFLGLAFWAVTRLFAPVQDRGADEPLQLLDSRLASGDLDPETYRRMREEMTAAHAGER